MKWIDPTGGLDTLWVLLSDVSPKSKVQSDWPDRRTSRDGRIEICPWNEGFSHYQIRTHDRPSWSEGVFFQVTQSVHDWFVESNIPYTLEWRWVAKDYQSKPVLGWHVGFGDPNHAMRFKLAWLNVE